MSVSLKPQHVGPAIWYYENRGSIHIYIDRAEFERQRILAPNSGVIDFKIPKRKLKKSLGRMGVEERR